MEERTEYQRALYLSRSMLTNLLEMNNAAVEPPHRTLRDDQIDLAKICAAAAAVGVDQDALARHRVRAQRGDASRLLREYKRAFTEHTELFGVEWAKAGYELPEDPPHWNGGDD